MKKKVVYLTILSVICMLSIGLYIKNYKKDKASNRSVKLECMDTRKCIYKEDMFLVGNNEKELSNGYYDVLFETSDEGVIIYVNKLWRNVFSEKLYENEYVEFVSRCIWRYLTNEKENIQINDDIKRYIIEGYCSSKKGLEYTKDIKLKKSSILFTSKNHELIIEVKSS